MLKLDQSSVNKYRLVGTGVSYDYLLLVFESPFTCVVKKVVCQVLNADCDNYRIQVEETGPDITPDNLDGQIQLSPIGEWQLKVYGQDNGTNLNESNATFIRQYVVVVNGDVCVEYPAQVSEECPECPEITEIFGGMPDTIFEQEYFGGTP